MSGHLVGPKVTLAVTDQSVLAEQTSSPRFHGDTIVFRETVKSHIDSVHYGSKKKVAALLFSSPLEPFAEACTLNELHRRCRTGHMRVLFESTAVLLVDVNKRCVRKYSSC